MNPAQTGLLSFILNQIGKCPISLIDNTLTRREIRDISNWLFGEKVQPIYVRQLCPV